MTRNLDRDRNRGQDTTAWGISDASHPAPIRIDEDGNIYVIQGNAGTDPWKSLLVAEDGTVLPMINYKLRVSSMPYLYDIAEGNVSGHTRWTKLGYTGSLVANTESDLWSAGGVINWPATAQQMEVVSGSVNDDSTVLAGDAVGNTVQSDAGGTTNSLVDADVDFVAAGVAAGDGLICDPHGATPEWGFITAVAQHQLTFLGGLSSGGTGASRYYAVLDYSAFSGAQAVRIEYLDGGYQTRREIVCLNAATPQDTVNTDLLRVQSLRGVLAGSGAKTAGAVSLRNTAGTTTFSYITAGFTRARNSAYTVPAGKTLYVTEFTVGYGNTHTQPHYCRLYTRANMDAVTGFRTGLIFYPYTEVICSNSSNLIRLDIPTPLSERVDIKVSAIADYAGIATCALRGWLEDN